MATRRRRDSTPDAVVTLERPPSAVDIAAAKSTVVLHVDSNGAHWQQTWVPIDTTTVQKFREQHEAGVIDLQEVPFPGEDFRAIEMSWLEKNHESLAGIYPGEWIAIDGPQLVAHAGSIAELLDTARAAGHPNPFITAIPSDPTITLQL